MQHARRRALVRSSSSTPERSKQALAAGAAERQRTLRSSISTAIQYRAARAGGRWWRSRARSPRRQLRTPVESNSRARADGCSTAAAQPELARPVGAELPRPDGGVRARRIALPAAWSARELELAWLAGAAPWQSSLSLGRRRRPQQNSARRPAPSPHRIPSAAAARRRVVQRAWSVVDCPRSTSGSRR